MTSLNRGRTILVIMLAALVALAVGACGSSSSSSSTSSTTPAATSSTAAASTGTTATNTAAATGSSSFPDYNKDAPPNFTPPTTQKTIDVLFPSNELPSQQSALLGFEQAAKKYNVKLTVFNAGGFGNVTTQVSQLETAVGEHPDAIIVVPTSPVALNAGIAAATKKGILVTAALIPPSAPQVKFSLVDPLPVDGATAAVGLAKAIGGKGDIYGIFGGAGGAPNTLFVQGALAALKAYPNIKLVYRKDFVSFSPSDAQTAVENGITAHPNVAGILTNDTGLAEGAYRALASNGKSSVPVVGLGPSTSVDIGYLRQGKIALADSPPFYAMGNLTLQWTLAILGGAKPAQRLVPLQPTVITKDNIDQAISSGALFQLLAPSTIGCGPGQSKQC
ncbi:MAG TPA: sugar ABC transporter substrate-binding protein [Solirubrobacteraceae bacterium]